MGGKITIVYREESGVVHSRLRTTGRLGLFLKNHRIADRDHDWMMKYLSDEEAPDDPWGKKDNKEVALAPVDYGIIVVDFKDNQFLSAQNYTTLDRISPTEATGRFYRVDQREERIRNFTEMPDGRLRIRKRIYTTFQRSTSHVEHFSEPLSNAEAKMTAEKAHDAYVAYHNPFRDRVDTEVEAEEYHDVNFVIDFSPLWTLMANDDDATSLLLIKDRMDHTGFEFSKIDMKQWDKAIMNGLKRLY